jgi:hypothetical protein
VKYVRICMMILVVAGAVLGVASCKRAVEKAVEEEPLLLLDEVDSNEVGELSGPVADNSRCYVCHMNFDGEGLTAMHAKHDISCEDCHGASDKHCSDEDNITPPDKMFAKEAINGLCKSCHPDGKLGGGKKYCVECHGEHVMAHRTRLWDKKTGILIEDDKVRMLTDEMLKKE